MRYGDVGSCADVEEVGGARGRCQVNEGCGWGPEAGCRSGSGAGGRETGNGRCCCGDVDACSGLGYCLSISPVAFPTLRVGRGKVARRGGAW